MDFTNTPRDVPPHRPMPGGGPRPVPQRRVFSDFAPRPVARPAAPQPAAAIPHPVSHPNPTPAPTPRPASHQQPQYAPRPAIHQPQHVPTQPHIPIVPTEPQLPLQQDSKSKAPRLRKSTGHASLVGFISFVIFTALLLSPLLPGKILDNFPGSSQSSSNGDQTIACIHDVTNSSMSLAYNTKAGSPVVYNYTATTTQTANCDGRQQSAVAGRTSQFNPLGLTADLLLALALAIGISLVWRKLLGAKD